MPAAPNGTLNGTNWTLGDEMGLRIADLGLPLFSLVEAVGLAVGGLCGLLLCCVGCLTWRQRVADDRLRRQNKPPRRALSYMQNREKVDPMAVKLGGDAALVNSIFLSGDVAAARAANLSATLALSPTKRRRGGSRSPAKPSPLKYTRTRIDVDGTAEPGHSAETEGEEEQPTSTTPLRMSDSAAAHDRVRQNLRRMLYPPSPKAAQAAPAVAPLAVAPLAVAPLLAVASNHDPSNNMPDPKDLAASTAAAADGTPPSARPSPNPPTPPNLGVGGYSRRFGAAMQAAEPLEELSTAEGPGAGEQPSSLGTGDQSSKSAAASSTGACGYARRFADVDGASAMPQAPPEEEDPESASAPKPVESVDEEAAACGPATADAHAEDAHAEAAAASAPMNGHGVRGYASRFAEPDLSSQAEVEEWMRGEGAQSRMEMSDDDDDQHTADEEDAPPSASAGLVTQSTQGAEPPNRPIVSSPPGMPSPAAEDLDAEEAVEAPKPRQPKTGRAAESAWVSPSILKRQSLVLPQLPASSVRLPPLRDGGLLAALGDGPGAGLLPLGPDHQTPMDLPPEVGKFQQARIPRAMRPPPKLE
jgi:hypothetical protein